MPRQETRVAKCAWLKKSLRTTALRGLKWGLLMTGQIHYPETRPRSLWNFPNRPSSSVVEVLPRTLEPVTNVVAERHCYWQTNLRHCRCVVVHEGQHCEEQLPGLSHRRRCLAPDSWSNGEESTSSGIFEDVSMLKRVASHFTCFYFCILRKNERKCAETCRIFSEKIKSSFQLFETCKCAETEN